MTLMNLNKNDYSKKSGRIGISHVVSDMKTCFAAVENNFYGCVSRCILRVQPYIMLGQDNRNQ